MHVVKDLSSCHGSKVLAGGWDEGCPAEAGLARKTLLDRLTVALVWEELTLQEIRRECQSRDVCFTGLRSRNEAEQRQELSERLFASVCYTAWETQGIPARLPVRGR
eukprot:g27036.t1